MSKQDYKRMFQEADDYNEELNKIDHPFENYGEIPGYDDIFKCIRNRNYRVRHH